MYGGRGSTETYETSLLCRRITSEDSYLWGGAAGGGGGGALGNIAHCPSVPLTWAI